MAQIMPTSVHSGEKLRINFDVTFPAISCSLLSIDVMDVSGSHQEDVDHTVIKKRLDPKGNVIGVPTRDGIGGDAQRRNATGAAAAVPAVKKSSLPGYCGSCYGAEDAQQKCCRTCAEVPCNFICVRNNRCRHSDDLWSFHNRSNPRIALAGGRSSRQNRLSSASKRASTRRRSFTAARGATRTAISR